MIDRRSIVLGVAAAAGAVTVTGPTAAAAVPAAGAARRGLDLRDPVDSLTAWIKLQGSLRDEDVWFHYGGRIELAPVGGPIRPLCDFELLVLRRWRRVAANVHEAIMWESQLFTDTDTGEPLASIVNPVTGRTVQPFHYSDGPIRFTTSEKVSRVENATLAGGKPRETPFAPQWRQAGDTVWATLRSYLHYPNPLPPAQWPLEYSGPSVSLSMHTTFMGSRAELDDPGVTRAACSFSYAAVDSWPPWLLMGQAPGYAAWNASGTKLRDLSELPAARRRMHEQVHPGIFDPVPWTDTRAMWPQFIAQRRPAT
jgi:hypothetical protein